jgi:hypothetical protein
VKLQYISTDE